MTVELFSRHTLRGLRWYWRVRAANGEKVAQSQSYANRVDALETARHVTGDRFPVVERSTA